MKFTEEQINETIDSVVYEMDWQKVSKVMSDLNWKWTSVGGVPSPVDLIKQARILAKNAINSCIKDSDSIGYSTATGGIYCNVSVAEDKIYLKICFALESYDNYD